MKTLYSFILILFCSFSFGQIKKIDNPKKEFIGKVAVAGASSVSIDCHKYEDDIYLFRYKDRNLTVTHNFKEISTDWKYFHINSSEDFETLYSFFIEGFKEMPNEKVIVDIGKDGFLLLEFKRSMGSKMAVIHHSTSDDKFAIVGYTYMYTPRQVDKLFGKR